MRTETDWSSEVKKKSNREMQGSKQVKMENSLESTWDWWEQEKWVSCWGKQEQSV